MAKLLYCLYKSYLYVYFTKMYISYSTLFDIIVRLWTQHTVYKQYMIEPPFKRWIIQCKCTLDGWKFLQWQRNCCGLFLAEKRNCFDWSVPGAIRKDRLETMEFTLHLTCLVITPLVALKSIPTEEYGLCSCWMA